MSGRRLLMVAPYFPPKRGGAENYAGSVGRGLAALGWRVTVVTTRHEGGADEVVQRDGLTIHRLARLGRISNTPVHPSWPRRLRRIIAAVQPEIINASFPVPILGDLAVRLAGRSNVVFTYHNDIVKEDPGARLLVRLYEILLLRGTLARAHRIIVHSELYARRSKHLQPHRHKIAIIPPGVDLVRFHPGVPVGDLRERYGSREVVVFAGQLDRSHRHKGVDVLLRAVALLRGARPNITCLVVGGGNDLETHRRLVSSLAISGHVEFTGEVGDEELPRYFRLARVVVLPSVNACESFGMVLLEAGACGTPVVATPVGGVPTLVEHERTGLLVPPGDPEALAQALGTLLSDPALARQLGENARQKAVEGYAWSRQIERHHLLFEELCGGARGS